MDFRDVIQIDLLAAARCNLFSHSLASYQTSWMTISEKNLEVLQAHVKLMEKEPRKHKFGILKELAAESEKNVDNNDEESESRGASKLDSNDKDQRLFFGDEFSDAGPSATKEGESSELSKLTDKLIDYEKEFDDELINASNILLPSQLLMDDSFFSSSSNGGAVSQSENFDLLSSLMPQKATSSTIAPVPNSQDTTNNMKNPSKKGGNNSEMSKWFSLFSDLDPLSQQLQEQDDANKNLHAA